MKKITILLFIVTAIVFITIFSGRRADEAAVIPYKDKEFTDYFRREIGVIAGDGAFSIPVGKSKSLWTFGDSYIDCYDPITQTVPCLFQARNAAVMIDIADPDSQINLNNQENIPTFLNFGSDDWYWFWPGSGYQNDDTIYIFPSRLKYTGPGMWGFASVDTNYIAKINIADQSKIYFSVLQPSDSIIFGLSVINDKKGFNYIYGIRNNGFGNDLFVARFPAGNVYADWQYYSGDGWTYDINNISKIYDEFTASFYVSKIKKSYVLITTEISINCDQGKNIYVSVSDNPYGPFTGKHSIWQVDDTLSGHYPFFYLANAHPEFDNGKDELLITYCINGYGDCVETCIENRKDPDVYRPKAIRVPYECIDKNL